LNASSDYNQLKQRLWNISKQIDRVELQFNKSIHQLLEKIDDNTLDILSSISAARVTQKSGKFSFF
jgi:hypothetical protein